MIIDLTKQTVKHSKTLVDKKGDSVKEDVVTAVYIKKKVPLSWHY